MINTSLMSVWWPIQYDCYRFKQIPLAFLEYENYCLKAFLKTFGGHEKEIKFSLGREPQQLLPTNEVNSKNLDLKMLLKNHECLHC